MKKEKRVVDNNNLGSFHKHINNRFSCRISVGALCSDDVTVITSDTSKAELLNDYFSSTCTRDNGVLPAFDKLVPNDVEFSSVTFTPDNVAKVMRKLNNSTSCGPDGLPPVMFRNLTGSLAGPISVLFDNSMSVVKLPTEWKKSYCHPHRQRWSCL